MPETIISVWRTVANTRDRGTVLPYHAHTSLKKCDARNVPASVPASRVLPASYVL